MNNIITESELKAKEDPKTFTITLTSEQRKLLMYTGLAFGVYLLAKHLVKSTLKSIRDDN